MQDFALLAGSASRDLTSSIARIMNRPVSASSVERFPDGELSVRVDEPVRGRPVFIVQSLSPPGTEALFELLLFVDACRRAAAGRITAIVPYLGYARADKRHGARQSIAASMVATLLQAVGIDHLMTIDLHAAQIEGFFHCPVDCLTAVPTICDELRSRLAPGTVIVSPDEGRIRMAGDYARRIGHTIAVLEKQRRTGIETQIVRVMGEVRDRPCLIIDDMISTAGTIVTAVAALLEAGARPEITVAATHGVLLENARDKLQHAAVQRVIVTDTVAPHETGWSKLSVVSVAPLFAGAIERLTNRQSFRDLFA